ncbi:MAG: hypothetical protein FJ148_06665 [Deltaproteobacteria bacterium]|nr:hypothetical protein [Deltaproteobacteria bacterium]
MLRVGDAGRRALPAVVIALVVFAFGASDAAARECHVTCQESRATCVDAAKVTKKGCKRECRDAADPGACRLECRQGFSTAKTTCKGTVVTCHEECERPCDDPGDEECVDECVRDLRECVGEVRDAGKSCARSCLIDTEVAAHRGGGGDDEEEDRGGGFGGDCWRAPDPLKCWLEKIGGVGKCLTGCAAGIEAGLDECAMAASGCRDACEKPPGSASRAFVARPGSLLD